MSKVKIFTNDGVGGSILACQAGHFVKKSGNEVDICMFARNEVFNPFKYLFEDQFTITQLPEDLANGGEIERNDDLWRKLTQGYDESYLVYPDALYLNPKRFDCKKYNVHPQTIKTTRLLTHKWKPENIVYCGLNTSTKDYEYGHIPTLLRFIAQELPDYKIYFNNLKRWAGKGLYNGDFYNLPKNVLYFEDQPFNESLEYLYKSAYCVCIDNGISHISYQLGMPRCLISNRFDNLNGLKWVSRWYEEINECIPYDKTPKQIADLIKINLLHPQSTLIPRMAIINHPEIQIRDLLMYKFQ